MSADRHSPRGADRGPRAAHGARPVRSYVRREGRITPAQTRALTELWPRYGVEATGLDLAGIFPRRAPLILDIGFGDGEALALQAQQEPSLNFLGIEVHRPGVGSLLRKLAAVEVDNVRVLVADAGEVLRALPDGALAGVQLYFPDPWPKKRHHKRRLLQAPFVALVARKLQPHGLLHVATDWDEYAQHVLSVCDACPELENLAGPGRCVPRPASRPLTKFERRAIAAGRAINDLQYRKR